MADEETRSHFSFEEIAEAMRRAIDFGWERAHLRHSTNGAPPPHGKVKEEIEGAVIAVLNEILVLEELRS